MPVLLAGIPRKPDKQRPSLLIVTDCSFCWDDIKGPSLSNSKATSKFGALQALIFQRSGASLDSLE